MILNLVPSTLLRICGTCEDGEPAPEAPSTTSRFIASCRVRMPVVCQVMMVVLVTAGLPSQKNSPALNFTCCGVSKCAIGTVSPIEPITEPSRSATL